MKNKGLLFTLLAVIGLFILARTGCQKSDGNNTGLEYMPDMGHSIAYEANTDNYYGLNTWSDDTTYHKMAAPRKPVAGTVPRGYAGLASRDAEGVKAFLEGTPVNGYVPYYFEDTEEERQRAMDDPKVSRANYMPTITNAEMAQAKELYDIFCGICHGEKGDGQGYLVREGGKYPAQPSNYLTEEFINATDGRYYHAIMYGKNVMGAYKDKLSFKERWMVIHYIRSLQAKELKVDYSLVAEEGETVTPDELPVEGEVSEVMTSEKDSE